MNMMQAGSEPGRQAARLHQQSPERLRGPKRQHPGLHTVAHGMNPDTAR